LIGFYGTKTAGDYLREQAEEKTERDKLKAIRRKEKEAVKRGKSEIKDSLPAVAEDEAGAKRDERDVREVGMRRMSKGFLGVFGRQDSGMM